MGSFSQLLDVQAYDEATGAFICSSGHIGFIWQTEPLSGVNADLEAQIRGMLQLDLPDNSYLSFTLVADDNLLPYISEYQRLRLRGQLEASTQMRLEFLQNMQEVSHDNQAPCNLRNYILLISLKIPVKGNITPEILADFQQYSAQSQQALLSIFGGVHRLNDREYLFFMRNLLLHKTYQEQAQNDSRFLYYDPFTTLAQQVFSPSSSLKCHKNCLELDGQLVQVFTPLEIPSEFACGQAVSYLGDLYTGITPLTQKFFLTCNLFFAKQLTAKSLVETKRNYTIRQMTGPLARFVPRLKQTAEAFDVLLADLNGGDKLVKLSWTLVAWLPPDYTYADYQAGLAPDKPEASGDEQGKQSFIASLWQNWRGAREKKEQENTHWQEQELVEQTQEQLEQTQVQVAQGEEEQEQTSDLATPELESLTPRQEQELAPEQATSEQESLTPRHEQIDLSQAQEQADGSQTQAELKLDLTGADSFLDSEVTLASAESATSSEFSASAQTSSYFNSSDCSDSSDFSSSSDSSDSSADDLVADFEAQLESSVLASAPPKFTYDLSGLSFADQELLKQVKIAPHKRHYASYKAHEGNGRLPQAQAFAVKVKSYFQTIGWLIDYETQVQLPVFLNALPLNQDRKARTFLQRERTMSTTQATVCLPLFAEWKAAAAPVVPLISRTGQIMNFDMFASQTNFNCCIAAQSGSGKSFLVNEIVVNLLATGAQCWIIDIGRSYKKLCEVYQGEFVEFNVNAQININPFSLVRNYEQDADMVFTLIQAMISPKDMLSEYQANAVKQMIKDLWEIYGANLHIDMLAQKLEEHPDKRLQDLAVQIFPFTSRGAYGVYFQPQARNMINLLQDLEQEINRKGQKSRLVVLELEELSGRKDLQQLVLLQLIFAVNQQMIQGQKERQKVLFIDEAWDLLASKTISYFIETGYRRFRKYNGAVVTITQSLEDLYTTPSGRAIAANSANYLLLAQKNETIKQLISQDKLVLDAHAIRQITSLKTRKGHYSEIFVLTDHGAGVGRLIVEPKVQLLYSTNAVDIAALNRLRELYACDLWQAIDILLKLKA